MQVNATPSTCTAKLITGWSLANANSTDPKVKVNAQLTAINNLKTTVIADDHVAFLRDNAIVYIFTTQKQIEYGDLDEFLPKCGFTKVFEGKKSNEPKVQREQGSGNLFLWAVEPMNFRDCTEAYIKELTALKEKIDPPKKPDPARAKFPTNILSRLRVGGIVQDNSSLKNKLEDILLVPEATAYMFIKNTFGIDIRKWNRNDKNWTRLTVNQLKAQHKAWVEELL
jgi:hypothetical protein